MKKILVIGGDFRQIVLAEELKKSGYPVKVYGFDKPYTENGLLEAENISDAVSESDVVVFGLPVLKDEKTVNTPLYSKTVYIDEIIASLRKDSVVTGGMVSPLLKERINSSCKGIFDYYDREELIIKNVIPTVEGAVAIAINETAITLHGSKILVIGYGRIGKYLSKALKALGAEVTVSARKNSDFAWIDCNGYKSIKTSELKSRLNKYDIIMNTVPELVIGSECIDAMRNDTVIIDLASKPGGIDINYAKYKGIKTIWALSLPGKTAPVTAGRIIKESIENILDELGV